MTGAQISAQIIKRIDDDPIAPVSVSAGEVLAAINEGQQLAALLTLFLEQTAPFALSGTFYSPRSSFPDMICPLRLTVGGVRLRPATLAELDALSASWQSVSGTPTRYFTLGSNFLGVTPQAAVTAQFTYAASPAAVGSGDMPVLPAAYHQDLVEYGVYRCRLKEGAQQLARGLGNLNTFLDSMTRLGDFVRAKSKAARYDVLPFELALFDRSKLVDDILKLKAPK